MSKPFPRAACAGLALWAGLAFSVTACAQTAPRQSNSDQSGSDQGRSAQGKPEQVAPAGPSTTAPATSAQPTPNAETPPGGIARGVIPPAHNVDPGIIEKPPASAQGTMPVIKPPGIAR